MLYQPSAIPTLIAGRLVRQLAMLAPLPSSFLCTHDKPHP